MMLVTYEDGGEKVGVAAGGRVADLATLGAGAPRTMLGLIEAWPEWRERVRALGARLARETALGRPLEGTTLLAPLPHPRRNPFLLAGNYQAHVVAGEKATGIALTQRKTAIFFTKPTNTVIGPGAAIEVDTRLTKQVDWECELVIVIGKTTRDVPRERAVEHIFGYTIGNDVSARDIQVVKPTTDFLRGKGLDTFFPLGPGITLAEDFVEHASVPIRCFVNGEKRQDALLGQMIRDVPEIVADLSRGLTLEAGDVIATGTPNGVAIESPTPIWLKDGDVVRCEIEGLGSLTNPVRVRA